MFIISPQFLGDSKSSNPQKFKEIIHTDIGSLILDQPLDLAIQHLQTLLNRGPFGARRSDLRLQSGPGGKIHLEGVRLETDTEVEERLERQRGYTRAKVERKHEEIRELETKIKSLREEVKKEEQR